jgi:hypothetical protein
MRVAGEEREMVRRYILLAVCCLLFGSIAIYRLLAGNHQAGDKPPAVEPKKQEAAASLTCTLSDEDYAVFTAVVESLGTERAKASSEKKEILVNDVTSAGEVTGAKWASWPYPSPSTPAPSAETRVEYKDKSRSVCPLVDAWGNSKLYRPFKHTEIDEYFSKKGHDGWEEFYRVHPQAAGFVTFSRPGFNSEGTEALLYVTYSCGWLCGTGYLYFLTRESSNSKWTVSNRLFLWVA